MQDDKIRTSSYQAQKAYDRMISDCDISSLRFLSEKYESDLDRYKQEHSLEDKSNWREYKNMQQRKKMIDEELTVRLMNQSATITKGSTYFDSDTGLIFSEDTGDIIGSADMDELSEEIYVRDFEGTIKHKYKKPIYKRDK